MKKSFIALGLLIVPTSTDKESLIIVFSIFTLCIGGVLIAIFG
ncbi:MAG: hypothetical protein ACOYMA_19370 [Bacteroidia bacterium]